MTQPLPAYLGDAPLHPAFQRAFDQDSSGGWDRLVEEVGPRVWAFPLLTPRACRRLLAEVDRRASERPVGEAGAAAPNSMHDYGVSLGELGMDPLLASLAEPWLAPLMTRHFEDVGAGEIDGRHGFLAEYGRDHDEALGFHVDDSAVTLNLCLGESFSGSELYFQGLRCDAHRQLPATPQEDFEYEHEVGVAILHAGRHRHGVHPIRRGRRRNLILWLQSSAAKQAARECQPWCGARGG